MNERLCDYFVHTIKELKGSDLMSQAFVDLKEPLHLNWVGILELISQPVINKQLVQLIP
jgi:hypothetical protein